MAESDAGERTEEATPRKREEARKKGQVVRSRELTTAAVTIGGAVGMMAFGGGLAQMFEQLIERNFRQAGAHLDAPEHMLLAFGDSLSTAMWALMPFLALLFVFGLAGSIAIGGLSFSGESIQPKFEKLSPARGLKRMFGPQAAMELLKSIGKFLVVGIFVALVLMKYADDFLTLSRGDVRASLATSMDILGMSFMLVSLSLLIIVAIDLPFQIWQFARNLRMSKQEVRDEYKEIEGNPETRGRIRRMQRQMAQQRMMQQVPKADVVITNPTHFAVALKYEADKPGAPRVLAKGVDHMALQIRKIADAHGVQILEAPPLARALYHSSEVDQEIPEGLYLAVAQVLAYVYSLKRYGAAHTPPPPADYPIPDDLRH